MKNGARSLKKGIRELEGQRDRVQASIEALERLQDLLGGDRKTGRKAPSRAKKKPGRRASVTRRR